MLPMGVTRSGGVRGNACRKPGDGSLEVFDLLNLVGVFETSAEQIVFFVRKGHLCFLHWELR